MSLASLINQRNMQMPTSAIDYDPTGLVDVTGATVDYFLKTQNILSRRFLENEQIDKQEEAFKKLEGRDIGEIIGYDAYNSPNRNDAIDEYIAQKRKEDERYNNVLTREEMIAAAKEKAKQSQLFFEETLKGASPLEATAGSILGGLGGSLADPVLLTAGLGGSLLIRTKSISKIIALEAGIGAGTETIAQPFISGWQKELGNEYGLGDALTNIAFAGLASAGFAGITSGALKQGVVSARNKSAAIFEMMASSDKAPLAVRSTLKEMANYARVREGTVYAEDTPRAMKSHKENVERVEEAINSGQKIDSVDLDTSAGRVVDEVSGQGQIETLSSRYDDEIDMSFNDYKKNQYDFDEETQSRILAQEELDFEDILNKDPNLTVRLDDEQNYRLAEIDEDAKAARALHDAIKVCSI